MIGKWIQSIISIFKFHKLKLFLILILTLIFTLIWFPYDDLSEVVSNTVSQRTNNQVSLQFDHLGFQLFPHPALAIENVIVDTAFFPTLQAERLSLAPSILGILMQKPGFKAGVREIWGGNIDLSVGAGKQTEAQVTLQNISLDIEKISLSKLNEVLNLPLKIQGLLSGESKVTVDPSFTTQPQGEIEVKSKDVRFPTSTIQIQVPGGDPYTPISMPVMIPGMSWSEILVKGKLKDGKLFLDKAQIGSAQDQLTALVTGEVDLRFDPMGGSVSFSAGAYNLGIELQVGSKLSKDLSIATVFISNFKQAASSPQSTIYKFRASGPRFGVPPSLKAF